MTQAERIMKKKALIRAEMDRRLPAEQSSRLWAQSTKALEAMLERFADIPRGEHIHTDGFILPSAAVYLTAKAELGAEAAFDIIEKAAIRNSEAMGKKLAGLMKLPGFAGLFVRLWDPLCKKAFGPNCGFKNVFYPGKKGEYKMDVVACPYNRYLTLLGCGELTKIFCENDVRIYGNLPGLQFIRHTTLGTGGERCDFYLRRI